MENTNKSQQPSTEKPTAVNAKAQKMMLILGGIFVVALIVSLFFGGNVRPPTSQSQIHVEQPIGQYDKANGFSDEIAFQKDLKNNEQHLASLRSHYHNDEPPQDWKQKEEQRVLDSRTVNFGLEKSQVHSNPIMENPVYRTTRSDQAASLSSDPRLSHLVLSNQQIEKLHQFYDDKQAQNQGRKIVGHNVNDSYPGAATKQGLLIPTGTVIRGSLDQELISDYTGAWRGIIVQDVYSTDNQFILLPKGTKVVGQSMHIGNVNEPIQNRMGLTIDWIVLPNGKRINCKKQSIQDRAGISAVGDSVDRHLLWQFTGVAAYALLSASLPYNTYNYYGTVNPTFTGQLGDGVRGQLEPLINKYLSLVPTVHLAAGTPIQIFIQDDLYAQPWSRVNTTVYQGVEG